MALLSVFTLIGSGAAFLTQILIARELGPDEFGIFASALATITAVAPFAGFGVQSFWLRVFGEEGWAARRWVRPTLAFSLCSTLAAMVIVGVVAIAGGMTTSAGASLLVLQVHMVAMAALEVVGTRFLLEERPLALMLWQTIPQLVRLAIVAAMYLMGFQLDAPRVALVFALVGLLTILGCTFQLRSIAQFKIDLVGHGSIEPQKAEGHTPTMLASAKGAWPYGFGSIFYQFYFQAAIISLTYILGAFEAGTYGAAASMLMAIFMVPNVVYQKLVLPRLHRWASQAEHLYIDAHARGIRAMFLLGLVCSGLVAALAPWGGPLVFGLAYRESGILLCALAVTIPFRFVSIATGASLSLDRYVRAKVAVMAIVSVLCISMNVSLIPLFGIWGAVFSTITGEAALVAAYAWVGRDISCAQKNRRG